MGAPGPEGAGVWLDTPEHRDWLADQARRQIAFFRASPRAAGGFHTLDHDGTPLPDPLQELHATTRMIHSYALAELCGLDGAGMVDHGMRYLAEGHADAGGWAWGVEGHTAVDRRKMAYGHVFVLLAASSAQLVGHEDAPALLAAATEVLDRHFWEEEPGLLGADFDAHWQPLSGYRGMNANMHGSEALMAAYEATGREIYLERAGRILDFFLRRQAPAHGWRIPEHYFEDWSVDAAHDGDPMFRPAGTTPGHSLEFARLFLQHWELASRPGSDAPEIARALVSRALADGWNDADGGLHYTVGFDGAPLITDRYWWPVTEGIGALASLVKLEKRPEDEAWYRRLWQFADAHFIDPANGGWFPEIDAEGDPAATQFKGKPDIYHALQATLYPLAPGLARQATTLPGLG